MKRFLLAILLSLVVVLGMGGCQTNRPPVVTVHVLDPSLAPARVAWQTEIARRFPDADAVFVHGGDFVDGQWIMATDPTHEHVEPAEAVIARYKRPGHPLILVSCNPGHIVLHNHPGVFYALDSVWVWPDRSLTPEMFTSAEAYQKIRVPHWLQLEDDVDRDPRALFRSRWESDPGVYGNIFEFIEGK